MYVVPSNSQDPLPQSAAPSADASGSQRFGDIAESLHELGYSVIPIRDRSKAPAIKDWTRYAFEQSAEDVQQLTERHPHCGIGFVTGRVVGLDLDVLDDAVIKGLVHLAVKKFGAAPILMVRRPKLLQLYRTEV